MSEHFKCIFVVATQTKVQQKSLYMNVETAPFWQRLQQTLFPEFEATINPVTEKHREIALIFDLVRVEEFVVDRFLPVGAGRPKADRQPMVRAFIAKSILNLQTTSCLLERLEFDVTLRRLCGWVFRHEVSCEATFSNAFREFSESEIFTMAHDALIEKYLKNTIVFYINFDSIAIEAREKHVEKYPEIKKHTFPKGRPKKDEIRPEKEPTRLEKQTNQS